jgi:asparagine synthase (glutamine-hydrolysing)
MSDRNICALLSGGLDSSLVASIVAKHSSSQLKTFSIGFEGSPDIHYAEIVAKHINSAHTSIVLQKEDFLNAIETVIKTIESYDSTTVRASVGNYLVAKYIKEHTD